MNPVWQDFLGASGARIDKEMVLDFGDLAAELNAGRDATIVTPLTHLGLIECSGDDAKSYLQNQLTSDINHLAPDVAQHAAWCSAKGRMLASFLLYRHGAGFQGLMSADLLESSLKRLQMFVLRSRVKLSDLSDSHAILGLSGPQATAALHATELPAPDQDMATLTFSAGVVVRLSTNRFVLIVEAGKAPALWEKLARFARPAGPQVWQWQEIQAGIPLISAATREAFVPQMTNFDKIGGVSFRKGCYPGQEVVARTQYLGKVKRHLYRIHTQSEFAAGASLFAPPSPPEQPCGMVVNAAPAPDGGYDAIAVIQESFVDFLDSDETHVDVPDLRLVAPGGTALKVVRIEPVEV